MTQATQPKHNKGGFMEELRKLNAELLSGAIAGTTGQIVCHPFDTVKTIYQDRLQMSYWRIIREIFENGVHNFWKGVSMPALTYGIVNGFSFGSYYYIKKKYDPEGKSDAVTVGAATVSALCQMVPWVPSDVIKIQMQQRAHLPGAYRTTVLSIIRHIFHTEGMRGFYCGCVPHAIRDLPNNVVYFLTYDKLSRLLENRYRLQPVMKAFLAGAATGIVAWVIIIPMDLYKTRFQTGADPNFRSFMHKVLFTDQLSFFRGSVISTIRACLINGITFVVYEQTFPVLDDYL